MGKRKGLSRRIRFEIFKRDGFTCQYCGAKPPNVLLEVDHIVPVASGGQNDDHNLITSCQDCNSGKSDKRLDDKPEALRVQLELQVEQKEQFEAYNKYLIEARKRQDSVTREIGSHWCDSIAPDSEKGKYMPCAARLSSIRTFLTRLPVVEIYDAMDLAVSKIRASITNDDQAWRYFCGICWKRIKEPTTNG